MPQELLAPDLATWPEENARLIGSRCDDCGAVTWPRQLACPRCSRSNMRDPDTFEPFAIGLVQLGDEIRVEARLTGSNPAKLRFGGDVELVFVALFHQCRRHRNSRVGVQARLDTALRRRVLAHHH
jgi:uncharacterized protein